ncbi:hypothetical protein IC582_023978 [Cucumis melo]
MIMVFNSIILPISYLFGTDSIAFQAFAPYERSTLTKGVSYMCWIWLGKATPEWYKDKGIK